MLVNKILVQNKGINHVNKLIKPYWLYFNSFLFWIKNKASYLKELVFNETSLFFIYTLPNEVARFYVISSEMSCVLPSVNVGVSLNVPLMLFFILLHFQRFWFKQFWACICWRRQRWCIHRTTQLDSILSSGKRRPHWLSWLLQERNSKL